MQVLVDMDGVVADFEGGFLDQWRKFYPNKVYVPIHERITHRVVDQYPLEEKKLVENIYHASGFFKTLRPIPNSVNSLKKMLDIGFDVLICSSPLEDFRNCVLEKYEWIEKYMGFDWTRRLILTKDKTLVRAEILIDDNPAIKGSLRPVWEQILYDQPWNRKNQGKRLTWETWQDVLSVNLG